MCSINKSENILSATIIIGDKKYILNRFFICLFIELNEQYALG